MTKWEKQLRYDSLASVRCVYWRMRAHAAEAVLRIAFRRRTRNRAEHIRGLEAKVAHLSETVTTMREQAERKNVEMKALNMLVACDGPCNSPWMDDPKAVTENVVFHAQRQARRLYNWWRRGGQGAHERYLARIREKLHGQAGQSE